jgi:ribosomal small subunit protein bTHX
MGKGDQRSKRGKIHVGTHGVTRLRKKKSAKKAVGAKKTVKKKAPKKAAKKAAK